MARESVEAKKKAGCNIYRQYQAIVVIAPVTSTWVTPRRGGLNLAAFP